MNKALLDRMLDLMAQATTERSHNYVAAVLKEAMVEILRQEVQIMEMKIKDGSMGR